MKAGQIVTIKSNGEKVQILSIDADDKTLVWFCYVRGPDMDGMIAKSALSA